MVSRCFYAFFDDFVVKCGAARIDYHICGRENGFAEERNRQKTVKFKGKSGGCAWGTEGPRRGGGWRCALRKGYGAGGKDGASLARMAPGFCVNGVALAVPVDGEAGACDGGVQRGVRRFLREMWVLLWLLCEVFFTIWGLKARGGGRDTGAEREIL